MIGAKEDIIVNITGKKKAKARRRKREAKMLSLMSSSPSPTTSCAAIAVLLVAFLALAAVAMVPAAEAAASSAGAPFSDVSKQLFVKYEQMAWHYSYQESEKQNLESFGKWWCQDLTDDSCTLTNNPSFIFMMRYFEQHRDSVLWNLTQEVPQAQQILPKHIKYIVSKDYADATNVEETFDAPWHLFVTWNQLAFHFDFAKTEEQNLQAFQEWLCVGPPPSPSSSSGNDTATCDSMDSSGQQLASMMWFCELHRDDILAAKAVKNLDPNQVSKQEIEGWFSVDYKCVIEDNASACNAASAAKSGDQQ